MKLGNTFTVTYQAVGRATGAEILMEVFDEAGVKVDVQSGNLVETDVLGVYKKDFTPDAVGIWRVDITDGTRKILKDYDVTTTDVDTVGSDISAVDGKVDTVDGKIVTVDGKVDTVDGKVVTVTNKVDTVDGKVVTVTGKVDTVSAKIDVVSGKCDDVITALANLDIQADSSPGMIG